MALTRGDFRCSGVQTNLQVIAAPAAGTRIELLRLTLTVDAQSDITLSNGNDASGRRIVDQFFGPRGGVGLDYMADGGYPLDAATALRITSSAGNVRVVYEYRVTK